MLSIGAAFAARCLLVLLFLPFSALDKLLNFQQAVGQAREAVPNRILARALIGIGFGIELLMSGAILAGIADRAAAVVLAAYCVATALLWKQFWKTPDFKLRGQSHGRDTFWDFLKNLALAGGFLMLASGADATGFRHFLDAPLSSSHPYRLATTAPLSTTEAGSP
jgi:putative oxidoreductase